MSENRAEVSEYTYQPLTFENIYEEDFDDLYRFCRDSQTHYFGVVKLKQKCAREFFEGNIIHRMKILDKDAGKDVVVGIAEFIGHAPLPALPIDCWLIWLKMHYCVTYPLSVANTLFVNHLSYERDVGEKVFHDAMAEVFLREKRLRYIIAIEMPYMDSVSRTPKPDYTLLRKHSTVFYPRVYNFKCNNVIKLHFMQRDDYLSKMHYRKAVPEDNDDIVEIVDYDHPELRRELGDFYIAEELLCESDAKEKHVTIICIEVENIISGFIWFNTNVDIELMVRNFEVELFNNLVRYDPNLPTKTLEVPVYTSFRVNAEKLFANDQIQHFYVIDNKEISTRKLTIADWRPKSNETHTHIVNGEDTDVNECYRSWLKELTHGEHKDTSSESTQEEGEGLTDEIILRLNNRFEDMKKIFKIFENLSLNFRAKRHYVDMKSSNLVVNYNVTDENDSIECSSNVFTMQLFGLSPTFDVRRAYRILLSAFCVFPERDFCLISVSPKIKMPKTAHELLKYFIPIGPRPGCMINDHLYITHRSTIHGDLVVQPVTFDDIPDIEICLSPLLHRIEMEAQRKDNTKPSQAILHEVDTVREILMDVLMNIESKFTFFTIRCGNSTKPETMNNIVGFVILREFSHSYFLKKHFRLRMNEDTQSSKIEILTLRLHPLYHCLSDDLFRSIARLVDNWQFYFIAPMKSSDKHLTNDLLNYMQPLEPRHIKHAWFMTYATKIDWNATGNVPSLGSVNLLQDKFALFSNYLLPTKEFVIRRRIIVSGFSDISKAFLRLMAFFWDSHDSRNAKLYTCLPRLDITVICPPGVVECEYDTDFACENCVDDKLCWINRHHCTSFVRDATYRLDLRILVHFVSGRILRIHRKEKCIVLEDKCVHYYDVLLLLDSPTHGLPLHLQPPELPFNYSEINYRYDKVGLFYKIRTLLKSNLKNANIIIYGPHLAPFDCIDFLLKHNIPPEWITLIVPYIAGDFALELKYNVPHMDTPTEYILQDMTADMGIKVYEDYNLVGYDLYPNQNHIAITHFEHYARKIKKSFETDLLINFNEISMTARMVKLCRDADIKMWDNSILVHENYQTSDKSIYAMGSHIVMRRAPNHQYMHVSPREEAEKLIRVLQLNPFYRDKPLDQKFARPHYYHCLLPKGYQYVKVTRPKRYLRNHLDNEFSRKLVTHKNGFCRVRLDSYGVVEEITAVTTKNNNYDFLQFFCGRHESLLNNLRAHYCFGHIHCFLEFFQQPWAQMVMHDSFHHEVEKPNKEIIMEAILKKFDLKQDRADREKWLTRQVPARRLETVVMQFLRKHRNDFDYKFALPEDFPQPYNGFME